MSELLKVESEREVEEEEQIAIDKFAGGLNGEPRRSSLE